ncbi:unnamed protein product [Cuscuta campestris]|uniref:Uncharacterized protein n=1 Tax=Cuscuta campestris TaxID=132261 RepID=A0A484M369_9ASTE|nr:unnamed protein product [Cuscuta campestris]
MTGFASKLKGLKPVLAHWSKNHFGNIFKEVKDNEIKAARAQEDFENDPTEEKRAQANLASANLILSLNKEVDFWKQKANIKWMSEGDCNSKIFHSFVKSKRRKLAIKTIHDDQGNILTTQEDICREAIHYFSNCYTTVTKSDESIISQYIDQVIDDRDNQLICSIPSEAEIYKAIMNLNPHSAAGPDVPRSFGSTFITLIPKIEDPKGFGDYRPISLSSSMRKINTKILATRLATLLPKFISEEQTGFQKNKGVEEQILLAEEMVHMLDKELCPGTLYLRPDSRSFLIQLFEHRGQPYTLKAVLRIGKNQLSKEDMLQLQIIDIRTITVAKRNELKKQTVGMKALNLKAEDIGKDSMMTSSSSKSPVGMLGTRVDKNMAGASGRSKAKSRAPTTSTEERLYYGDGSYLWFDSEEERTRFLTFFSKRVVAPPRIIPERYPELQGYDDLDAQLHQAGLWPFVSRARKEINPALIRVFDSNLRRDDVSLYGGEDWVLNNEGLILNELGITELIRHASGRPTIHSANPDGRLLLYIISRIIKPRKHGHTIMSGEDLKLIHAIVHSAPINWAKFVMINMTISASTDHDHLLPYPFVVMDILERFKVTTTVGPLTKATKIWAVSTQTFKKRSDNAGPATAKQRRRSAAGSAEAQARANLASIADSLNRLHFKVDGMDGYLERLDEAVQCQWHAMNAYFQRVNYVPPLYHGTFFGQVCGDEDKEDGSYTPSSSPDEDEFNDAVDGDEMDVDDDEEETEDEY